MMRYSYSGTVDCQLFKPHLSEPRFSNLPNNYLYIFGVYPVSIEIIIITFEHSVIRMVWLIKVFTNSRLHTVCNKVMCKGMYAFREFEGLFLVNTLIVSRRCGGHFTIIIFPSTVDYP